MPSQQQSSPQNHVYSLPTGYRFAMASVVDDAAKKAQEAKYLPFHPSNSDPRTIELDWIVELIADTDFWLVD
jgi:hypothetical protein